MTFIHIAECAFLIYLHVLKSFRYMPIKTYTKVHPFIDYFQERIRLDDSLLQRDYMAPYLRSISSSYSPQWELKSHIDDSRPVVLCIIIAVTDKWCVRSFPKQKGQNSVERINDNLLTSLFLLRPSGKYMNHLFWQSVMLHFVFIGFACFSL
jgi:hypothetical protein